MVLCYGISVLIFYKLQPYISQSKLEICVCKQTLVHILILVSDFQILSFLTFNPLTVGRTKRSPWTPLHVYPKANLLTPLVLQFNDVWNLTFFDLWPLNRRSDEEVTVKTFACLSKGNMLAPLVLLFDVVWNLTFLYDLVTPNDLRYIFRVHFV